MPHLSPPILGQTVQRSAGEVAGAFTLKAERANGRGFLLWFNSAFITDDRIFTKIIKYTDEFSVVMNHFFDTIRA